MAFVNQYEIDQQQDQRNRQNQAAIGDAILGGFQAFNENRRRALDLKRANEATATANAKAIEQENIGLAKSGVSPEMIEQYRSSGDASGIQRFLSDTANSARDDARDDKNLTRDVKRSQIAANNATAAEKAKPFEESREGKAYIAKQEISNKNKEPTQGQWGAGNFANRMRQSEVVLSDLDKAGFDRSNYANSVRSSLPEFTKSEDMKKYEQAKRTFINAALRKESGAAIADSEFESADKQYFEQPGDSEAVKTQKRNARIQVANALEAEAGDKVMSKLQSTQPSTPAPQQPPASPVIAEKVQSMTPDQKATRLEQLRAKKAGMAQGGR